MPNLRHNGEGRKLLVHVLTQGKSNVKHWLKQVPTRIQQIKDSGQSQKPPAEKQ